MKKYLKLILPIIFCLIIFGLGEVEASSGSTIFVAEPVVLDSYTDVEITSIDEQINEETSEVKSTQIFTNLSDKTITKKASVKLEDSFHNFTINSLVIKVNELEITEITKEEDNYIFYFQIKPNEAKKIEISYKTDNDLQNARVLKYSMDSMKEQKVKLYKISINLNKYDIPLVEKIWPGAYEFENNTVSTEYFDFTVNNLTSSFIIQKETYRNLKYGDNEDKYSDEDNYIINNAKDLIDNGLPDIEYEDTRYRNNVYDKNDILRELTGSEEKYVGLSSVTESIFKYLLVDRLEKDNKLFYDNNNITNETNIINIRYDGGFCLTLQKICEKTKNGKSYVNIDRLDLSGDNLYGKKVAINYYETEGNKQLYVYKNLDNSSHSVDATNDYVIRPEYSLLRTFNNEAYENSEILRGQKYVYVNSDIDGNKIDITEEEILEFVNMMNIDLYLRVVIHDTASDDNMAYCTKAAYYTDKTKEIADKYTIGRLGLNKEIQNINEKIENLESAYEKQSESTKKYTTKEKWIERTKDNYESEIERLKKYFKKFENEIVAEKAKIPTLAHCIAKCTYKDGKNIVEFVLHNYWDGYDDIYNATECDTAKQMLAENETNNNNIKDSIINRIDNLKITKDTEEYKKPKDVQENEFINNDNQNANGISNILNNPVVLGIIIAIVILIIIIIFLIIRRVKNGRKQEKN